MSRCGAMSDAEWDERVRRMELRMNPETLDKMLNRPSGAGEAVASAVALSPGPAAPSPAELFAASDWSRVTYKAPLRKSILTERDAFELRYYRARQAAFELNHSLLDGILAPAMLPSKEWSVSRVASEFGYAERAEEWPCPAQRLVELALASLHSRLVCVHAGAFGSAAYHDPEEYFWGLGL